jgi:VanZ family protein
MIYKILFWSWIVIISLLSVWAQLPVNNIEKGYSIFRIDYMAHLIAYFLLGFFFIKGFLRNTGINYKSAILIVGIGLIYAGLTEVVQLYVRGRTFNPLDLIYNCAGITIGLAITMASGRRHSNKN